MVSAKPPANSVQSAVRTSRVAARAESVLVVIFSHDARVLLLRRLSPPDFWQSVTGRVQSGESAAQAARREVAEETGLDAARPVGCGLRFRFPILPGWRHRYAPELHTNLEHVFALRLPRALPVALNPDEHDAFRWLDAFSAAALACSETNRRAIHHCLQLPDPAATHRIETVQ